MSQDDRFPLVSGATPQRIVAYRPDGPVSVAQFLADVAMVAAALPAGRHVLNICQDRYRFMVGFAAALVAGKLSLLPASHTPETVRQLLEFAPDIFCLHDGNGEDLALPLARFPLAPAVADPAPAVPMIPAERLVGYLFTSGTTGTPVPHPRRWGALVRSARAEAARLGIANSSHAIVGTVPAQHSYGLESTILLALHGDAAAWSGRPFYPADIADALAAVPQPRMLVTTPFHLRSLLDADVAVPPLELALSATAPLSQGLATHAEARLGTCLHEIYGCTEAGQVASRRTSVSLEWTPLPGVAVIAEGDGHLACGGHVDGRVPLSDLIESVGEGRFLLHGRNADLINIAGKRTSLAYLDHHLNAIAGVEDGCFFMPDETDIPVESISRLCAFVAAPGLGARQVMTALRERIDPIFLPRPLIFVPSLQRNATGKLLRNDLQALYARHRQLDAEGRS